MLKRTAANNQGEEEILKYFGIKVKLNMLTLLFHHKTYLNYEKIINIINGKTYV